MPASDLRDGLEGAVYRPRDLAHVGFVHCAAAGSVLAVADDYYADVAEPLVLLEIDAARLGAETRYEPAAPRPGTGTAHLAGAPAFPHVYGPIETRAIRAAGVLARGPDGFAWPDPLEPLGDVLAALRTSAPEPRRRNR